MDKNKIIGIAIALLLIGVMFPIGLTFFYEHPVGSNIDLNENCIISHEVTFEKTGTSFNVSINKVDNSTFESAILVENSLDFSNYTIDIESDTSDGYSSILNDIYFASFVVDNDCYLSNISCFFDDNGAEKGNPYVYLLNSSWNGTTSVLHHNPTNADRIGNFGVISDNSWVTSAYFTELLNNSLTQNNTWFIGLYCETIDSEASWSYDSNDLNEESINYYFHNGNLIELPNMDYLLKVEIQYLENSYTITEFDNDVTNHIDYQFTSDVEFTLNATITTYCILDYTLIDLVLTSNIIFVLDGFAYNLNTTYNSLFNVDVLENSTEPAGLSDLSGNFAFDLTNNTSLLITFSLNTSVIDIYNMFPLFVVIAIVLIIVYEIKQKQED